MKELSNLEIGELEYNRYQRAQKIKKGEEQFKGSKVLYRVNSTDTECK